MTRQRLFAGSPSFALEGRNILLDVHHFPQPQRPSSLCAGEPLRCDCALLLMTPWTKDQNSSSSDGNGNQVLQQEEVRDTPPTRRRSASIAYRPDPYHYWGDLRASPSCTCLSKLESKKGSVSEASLKFSRTAQHSSHDDRARFSPYQPANQQTSKRGSGEIPSFLFFRRREAVALSQLVRNLRPVRGFKSSHAYLSQNYQPKVDGLHPAYRMRDERCRHGVVKPSDGYEQSVKGGCHTEEEALSKFQSWCLTPLSFPRPALSPYPLNTRMACI
ncbi:hypothetical protein GE09DRAFT_353637 [Coniochaeta sp. 2T2.1]|nr:hypothetical protein GE09DRAFT_353637 [Coniochaeta sp. 2T2.1]